MAFKIQVSGADLPAGVKLKTQTLTIEQPEPGARNVLSCEIIDTTGSYVLNAGTPITVIEDSATIYGGFCEGPDNRKLNNVVRTRVVHAGDYQMITDRRLVNDSFARQPAGDIVRQIITDYLAADGITEGDIEDGPDVGIINVPYYPASQVFNEICNLVGFTWKINPDKSLDFTSRIFTTGPAITASSDFLFSSVKVWNDISDYRNKQILRNIPSTTIEMTEIANPSPDGVVKTFYVRYPLASKPAVEINTGGGGWVAVDPNDVGILGIDTGKKWYWNKEANSFTQDDAETELAIGDYVRLIYYGMYMLTVEIDDPIEIATQKAIEGGSGVYEDVQDAPELSDITSAAAKAIALLRRFGKVATKLQIASYTIPWQVGQLCSVTLPDYGLSGNYLVMGLTLRDTGRRMLLREAVLIDGEVLGGWVNFFRTWLESTQSYTIRENELIRKIQLINETTEWSGSASVTGYAALYPAEDLFPAADLYAGSGATIGALVD